MLDENGLVAKQWELGNRPVTVGRDGEADLVVPDDALSRRHFMIVREGGHYVLQDLDSQNGTSVDGQRGKITRLKQNDCILAGRTLFLFHEHPLPAGAVPGHRLCSHNTAFLPAVAAAERAEQRSRA
jgi:pSer/pThr/pTyr-binding forkhead associated (FHA) protein